MADRQIVVRLKAEVDSYQQAMRRASDSTAQFGKEITGHGKASQQQIEQVGRSALAMSAVVGGGLALSGKAAIDWGSAWAGVAKTTDGTAAQMANLEQGLREMATELPATHAEIAGVAEAAGQLGVSVTGIESFTRTMIDLGETTDLTAEQAAAAIARIANIMGTTDEEVSRFGATLVDLGNNSAATESEILELANRLAAAGKAAGLSESDVLAYAATLSSVGVEAEAGGTALSKVFRSIRDSVIEGGDSLDTFAKVAGMSTGEFKQAFAQDAAGAIASFVEGLGMVTRSGQSTTQILEDLELTDLRLKAALEGTALAGDLLRESLDRGNQAWEDNAALQEEAARRYGTTQAKVEVLRNNLVDLGIEVGEVMMPAVESTVSGATSMVQALSALPAGAKAAGVGLAGVAAAGLGVVGVVGTLAPKVRETQDALKNMGTAGQFLDRNMGRVAIAMSKAAVQVGVLYVAGEALDATVNRLSEANLTQLENSLLQLGQGGELAGEGASALGDDFGELADAIERVAAPSVLTQASHAINEISTFGGLLGRGVEGIDQAKRTIDDLDKALASLATLDPGAARRALSEIEGSLSPEEFARLRPMLDDYEVALAAIDTAARAAAGGVDETSGAMDRQVGSAQSAADAAEELIASYQDGFNAVFAYQEAQQALTDGTDEAAESQRAIADAQRDATDAAAAIEEAQMGVAKAMLEVFNAAESASKAVDDYVASQRSSIDPVFAMIRALEELEDVQKRAAKGMDVEKDGTKMKASGDAASTLDVADANLGVDQAAARLAGAIATGQVSIAQVRATLTEWVRQGRLSADQAAELGAKMDVAAGQAESLEGANVRGAIASRVAADEAEFQAEKADKVAEAQKRVTDATRQAEDANRRVADAMREAGEKAEDAARKHMDLEAAALRLEAALKDNPKLLQEMIDTVDRWVDKGFFSESQAAGLKQRILDSINGAIWTANELDLKVQAELELITRDGETKVKIPGGGFAFAEGGIMSYADGGISQAHIATQQMIKYAEPQTGGEAYIPKNGPLSRVAPVLGEAAGWHGMEVRPAGSGQVDNSLHVSVGSVIGEDGLLGLRREVQSLQNRRSLTAIEHRATVR